MPTRHSTREILVDRANGKKSLGHNPSWVKAVDYDALKAAHSYMVGYLQGMIDDADVFSEIIADKGPDELRRVLRNLLLRVSDLSKHPL